MRGFLKALRDEGSDSICTGPQISLESHQIVFAAERTRKAGTVESL